MTTVTRFDLLEGEDEAITVKDQAGRVLPNTAVSFALDDALTGNLTVVPKADGTDGWVVHAVAPCTGTMTVTATRGAKTVQKPFPVAVSADLTDISIETP